MKQGRAMTIGKKRKLLVVFERARRAIRRSAGPGTIFPGTAGPTLARPTLARPTRPTRPTGSTPPRASRTTGPARTKTGALRELEFLANHRAPLKQLIVVEHCQGRLHRRFSLLLHFGEGRLALGVGLIGIEPGWRCRRESSITFLTCACWSSLSLSLATTSSRVNACTPSRCNCSCFRRSNCLASRILATCSSACFVVSSAFLRIGKTLPAFFLAQVLHLAKVSERRPHLLLGLALEVVDFRFLVVAEREFFLNI